MADAGWLKLYRRMRDHWLWKQKPFSPGQAWIDLLLRVNFSERPVPRPGRVGPRTLQPGQAIVSIRNLGRAWGWSRGKTERFIRCLQSEAMIEATNQTTYTLLNLLNWKKYQPQQEMGKATPRDGERDTDGPPTGPQTGHQQGHGQTTSEERPEDQKDRREEGDGTPEGKSAAAGDPGRSTPPPSGAAKPARLRLPEPSTPALALATAYLRLNPGVIGHKKAAHWFDFALARGAPEQDLSRAVNDPETKGLKVWEVFEPLCPPRDNGGPAKTSWLDDMMARIDEEG